MADIAYFASRYPYISSMTTYGEESVFHLPGASEKFKEDIRASLKFHIGLIQDQVKRRLNREITDKILKPTCDDIEQLFKRDVNRLVKQEKATIPKLPKHFKMADLTHPGKRQVDQAQATQQKIEREAKAEIERKFYNIREIKVLPKITLTPEEWQSLRERYPINNRAPLTTLIHQRFNLFRKQHGFVNEISRFNIDSGETTRNIHNEEVMPVRLAKTLRYSVITFTYHIIITNKVGDFPPGSDVKCVDPTTTEQVFDAGGNPIETENVTGTGTVTEYSEDTNALTIRNIKGEFDDGSKIIGPYGSADIVYVTDKPSGHAISVIRNPDSTTRVFDPHGRSSKHQDSNVDKIDIEAIRLATGSMGDDELTQCSEFSGRLQRGRGTCLIWTFIRNLFPDKTDEEFVNMVDAGVIRSGAMVLPESERTDLFVIAIIENLLENGFRNLSLSDSYEWRTGLGKPGQTRPLRKVGS